MDEILINEDERGVVTITLNRPKKGNSLTPEMIDQLSDYLKGISESNTARTLLVIASGEHFCAGADLEWMKSSLKLSDDKNRKDAKRLADLYFALYNLDIPTVAMVQGSVYGGGLGLVACSDIVIAAENAKFCFSEVKLGLAPATIAPYVVQAIGARAAMCYFLSAEKFDTPTAEKIGLIHKVVNVEELELKTQEIIDHLYENGIDAMRRTKHLVRSILPIDEGLCEDTVDLIAKLRQSDEAQVRLRTFLS